MPRTPPPVRTAPPATSLRRRYERTRELDPETQLREIVDYLENPQVLIAEYVDAWCAVESCAMPEDLVLAAPVREVPGAPAPGDLIECDTTPPQRWTVVSAGVPLLAPVGDDPCSGIDYTAMPTGESGRPLLAFRQGERDRSPFPLLLRALASATEIGPDAQLQSVAQTLFKAGLGEEPAFDLQIVLAAEESDPQLTTLGELTRDLAETFRDGIGDEWHVPERIASIQCVRLGARPLRFEPRWIA